jgi:hypothetical protein
MAEMHADLLAAEQGQTPKAVLDAVNRSSSTTERRDATGRLLVTMGEPEDVVAPKSKLPLVLGAGGVLALLGAAGIAFAVLGGGGEETSTPVPPVTPPVVEEPPAVVVAETANDENVEEQGSTETMTVTITSVPDGVEVWRADELLGNTPFTTPKPREGEPRLELVLRHAGHLDQPVRISSQTAASVRISLREERAVSSRRSSRGSMRSSSSSSTMTEAVAETPAMTAVTSNPDPPAMMRTRTTTEVLDPWGE